MIRDGIERVFSPSAPPPGGHYSHATVFGDLVMVSGQLPISPDGTHNATAGFDEQAHLALDNLFSVINSAGASAKSLIKVTAYIVDVNNWPAFNQVFANRLSVFKPARTVVPVPELHYGYLIEIDAVAVRDLSLAGS